MPQTTPKLGMTTYDLVNDGSVYFSTFRTTLAGYTNSALTKIDDFATQISADVNLLKSNPPIVRISAIKTDDFSYAVTGITEVTTYNNGMYINLSLDNTNIGTVSLNINNLGTKGVYKIGADGLVANMSARDLRKNKMNLFRYNGTAWVWVNAITSDQLNIVGTVGNLTKISSDNTLEDSGVTFSTTVTNNTLVQRTSTGQIKGVTPSANDDLTNKQYADTKAPLASPSLTGTPTAPTATTGTNTTQIATTAFVKAEISNDRPYATTTTSLTNGGTGTVGTSSKVARADHTHTLPRSVLQTQVINNLTTGGATNVLSAEQGKVLSSEIGQKADKTQVSNPNLLINGDFPVWQRGVNFSSSGYTSDRWRLYLDYNASHTISKDANGLKVTKVIGGTTNMCYISYNIDEYAKVVNKKRTLSICVDGVVYSHTIQNTSLTNIIFDLDTFTFSEAVATNTIIDIRTKSKTSLVINWVKLELGDIATPFSPRSYAEELAMCQRYYQIRSTNNIPSVDMSPLMRIASPTIGGTSGEYTYDAEIY